MATDQFDDSFDSTRQGSLPKRGRPVSGRWHPVLLLLLVPIVLSLFTPFYNRQDPHLFGFPAFYWMQLAFVLVGVASTTIVYQVTKHGRDGE